LAEPLSVVIAMFTNPLENVSFRLSDEWATIVEKLPRFNCAKFPYDLSQEVLNSRQASLLGPIRFPDMFDPNFSPDEQLFNEQEWNLTGYRSSHNLIRTMARNGRIALTDLDNLWATIYPDGEAIYQTYLKPYRTSLSRYRDSVPFAGSFIPIDPRDIPKHMERILDLINCPQSGVAGIDSAIRILHGLVWVHPYPNGNGRLAVQVFKLKLLRSGYPVVALPMKRETFVESMNQAHEGDPARLADEVCNALLSNVMGTLEHDR